MELCYTSSAPTKCPSRPAGSSSLSALFEESAAAIVSQSLTEVHERYPDFVTKGEHHHGYAGSVLVEAAKGASLLVVGWRGHSELTGLLVASSTLQAHHVHVRTLIAR